MYPLIDQLFQTKCSNREFIKCRTPHTCKRHLHDFQVFLHAKVLTSQMKRFHMWWMYFWPVKNHQQEFHMSFLSSENHLTPCLDVAVTDDRCKSATHLWYGILPFNEVEPEWALKCCYVKSHPADPHRRQHQREQHGLINLKSSPALLPDAFIAASSPHCEAQMLLKFFLLKRMFYQVKTMTTSFKAKM